MLGPIGPSIQWTPFPTTLLKLSLGSTQANLILSITSGPRAGERMIVPPGEVRTIGRTIASDVAVEDNFMSGIHFELHNFGSYIELRDKNSTNKTFVNHSAQMRCNVTPGDVIRAGKTLFSLQWEILPKTEENLSDSVEVEQTYDSQAEDSFHSSSPIGSSFLTPPEPPPVEGSKEQNNRFPEPNRPDASSRNSSPFESLDASYLLKMQEDYGGTQGISADRGQEQNDFRSPFDESSVGHFPFQGPIQSNPSESRSHHASARFIPSRLTQNLDNASDFDTCSMIDSLSKRYDLRVIVHFRKIGQLTPDNLRMESVFPFLAESWRHLPVIVHSQEWERDELRRVSDSLVKSDGLMLVLANGTAANSIESALQRLCSFKVHGLSESNGFLGWCWPSQFQLISNTLSDSCLSDLFGDVVQAIVFPSNTGWTAYANPDLAQDFSTLGFE